MRKAIAVFLLVCIAMLCVGCTSAGANGDTSIAEAELYPNEEMKVGKYYREGGTDGQYIEIYENYQIQLFGFDLYQRTVDMNKALLDSMTEDEREYTLSEIKKDAELRESRIYYQRESTFGDIVFKLTPEYEENLGGPCLIVID